MATFTNTTTDDLDVYVDGVPRFVVAGASFDVPDEFADGFRLQPAFSEVAVSKKTTAPAESVTPPAPAASEGVL